MLAVRPGLKLNNNIKTDFGDI